MSNFKLDQAGVLFSLVCFVHCMIFPLFALLSPALAKYFESEWLHLTLLFLIVPTAVFAFFSGYKNHGQKTPFALGLVGVGLLIWALSYESLTGLEITRGEQIFTTVGCFFMIAAHWLNMKSFKTGLQ